MNSKYESFLDECNFSELDGLIPVVVQDIHSKDVLMLAYTNKEGLRKTFLIGQMVFYSRKRGLWHKGETSGNFLDVVSLHLDCDKDTILAMVKPQGSTCHRDYVTCFIETPSIKIQEG